MVKRKFEKFYSSHLMIFHFRFQPELIICPSHRYNLGLLWKPSRTCGHPDHKGKKKVTKVVSAELSRKLFQNEGILVPLGTGILKEKENSL